MNDERLKRLITLMQQREVDAVALVPGSNLFYMTGLQMHPSERVTLALITKDGEGYLLLPRLEAARAEGSLSVSLHLVPWTDEDGTAPAWKELGKVLQLSGKSIAVESLAMRVLELTELQRFAPNFRMSDASLLLAELRMIKEADEVDAMRRAAAVIDSSLKQVLELVKPGIPERELATQWRLAMNRCGADSIPEEPIVASGPNSAAPHIASGDRRLQRGDMIILDGWCQVDGYYTDITRSIALGEPSERLRKVHQIVKEANEAGRRAAAPGASCEQVDRAAREVISRAGWGEQFVHRTGHGLGLEVHEAPAIVEGNPLILKPGMTCTVEPGVYLAGEGGVRIEDDVVVTQDGCETLTNFTRELIVQ